MATILIIDDEKDYREELELILSREGHTVFTAVDSYSAIDLGLREKPEMLIVDWMLKDSINGLTLVDVMRIVNPAIQVVLISGFGSRDLRFEADAKNAYSFLDKPFSAEQIKRIAREAEALPQTVADGPLDLLDPVGVIEIDEQGRVLYMNPHMEQLCADLGMKILPQTVQRIFGPKALELIENAAQNWCDLLPLSDSFVTWSVRLREWPESRSRFLFILEKRHALYQRSPIVRLLVGESVRSDYTWPSLVHLLVVDNQQLSRRIIVESFRRIGCACHAATTCEEAIQLLTRDSDILIVVIDYEVAGEETRNFINEIRSARPGIIVVGTSRNGREASFDSERVDHYLEKPWVAKDLIQLLALEEDSFQTMRTDGETLTS